MHSKVSSDQLPNFIKATLLEIFQMARYFLDSPHKVTYTLLTVKQLSVTHYVTFVCSCASQMMTALFTILTKTPTHSS